MKFLTAILMLLPFFTLAQIDFTQVSEIDNTFFKLDRFWRGADGGATVALGPHRILWLFSDTFIDLDGTGKRSNAKSMIRNSIAIQHSISLDAEVTYHYRGTVEDPQDFFQLEGGNWFWTGHGVLIGDKLVVFLMEVKSTNTGLGFEIIGWWMARVDNPADNPDNWIINYFKGPETFGVIAGSSAVLQEADYIYTFGVKEPDSHETYLFRFEKTRLYHGDLSNLECWIDQSWTTIVPEEPKPSSLFIGQTEFSVHFDRDLNKYIQIQTYGFGQASLGYRLADQLQGPWSEPVLFYAPVLQDDGEFVYSANAHPELSSQGIIITYNVNHASFERLLTNENIYFPKIIKLQF